MSLDSRGGWIRLHRKMMDSDQWKMSDGGFKVWVTILLSANIHADEWYSRRLKKMVEIPRGAFVTTERALAEAAEVGRHVVRTALEQLSTMKGITAQRITQAFTLIGIVNFDTYQAEEPEAAQDTAQARPKPGPGSRSREVEKESRSTSAPPGFYRDKAQAKRPRGTISPLAQRTFQIAEDAHEQERKQKRHAELLEKSGPCRICGCKGDDHDHKVHRDVAAAREAAKRLTA